MEFMTYTTAGCNNTACNLLYCIIGQSHGRTTMVGTSLKGRGHASTQVGTKCTQGLRVGGLVEVGFRGWEDLSRWPPYVILAPATGIRYRSLIYARKAECFNDRRLRRKLLKLISINQSIRPGTSYKLNVFKDASIATKTAESKRDLPEGVLHEARRFLSHTGSCKNWLHLAVIRTSTDVHFGDSVCPKTCESNGID